MKALICFNSCDRVINLKRYVPSFLRYCRVDRDFDFIVSLDGHDPPSVQLCSQLGIPLLYSSEREGVGLAKNRVLKQCEEYDYYFFIDDDVELLDARVFREHIRISQACGFQHMSLFEKGGARDVVRQDTLTGHKIVFARYGGGQFNFFARAGLQAVGGWHIDFAKHRRFGHTEHSYRFVNRGLAEAAFVVAESLAPCLLWHYPYSVTRREDKTTLNPATELSIVEEALMSRKLSFFPVFTPSAFCLNEWPIDCSAADWVDDAVEEDRYCLLSADEKRKALADYYVALSRTQCGASELASLARALWLDRSNLHLRHVLKQKLTGKR